MRTGKPCLSMACNKLLATQPLFDEPHDLRIDQVSALHIAGILAEKDRFPNRRHPSAHSNYISVRRRSGFLQVVFSGVPRTA